MKIIELALIFPLIILLIISSLLMYRSGLEELGHETEIGIFCLEGRISQKDFGVSPDPIYLLETCDLIIDTYGTLRDLKDIFYSK